MKFSEALVLMEQGKQVIDDEGNVLKTEDETLMVKIRGNNGFIEECATFNELCSYTYKLYEPPVDMSGVEVDTKVLVKDELENEGWEKRHFAKYENGRTYTYVDGKTSWSNDNHCLISWKYAKLAED